MWGFLTLHGDDVAHGYHPPTLAHPAAAGASHPVEGPSPSPAIPRVQARGTSDRFDQGFSSSLGPRENRKAGDVV